MSSHQHTDFLSCYARRSVQCWFLDYLIFSSDLVLCLLKEGQLGLSVTSSCFICAKYSYRWDIWILDSEHWLYVQPVIVVAVQSASPRRHPQLTTFHAHRSSHAWWGYTADRQPHRGNNAFLIGGWFVLHCHIQVHLRQNFKDFLVFHLSVNAICLWIGISAIETKFQLRGII